MAFWQGAIGAPLPLPGSGLGLLVQRLGTGPGRVHLDIHTDDVAAETARLERLGARRSGEVSGWWIMGDPAGLLLCVVPEKPGVLTQVNARRRE